MSHVEFHHLLQTLPSLSPDQLETVRRELDAVAAQAKTDAQPAASQELSPQPSHKPIWEQILELTADVPDEVWDKLPTDLSEQHDHYLYGTPKRIK